MVETPPHDPLTEANVQKLEAATMPVRVRSAARDGDEQEADEAAGLASIAKTHLEEDRGHKLLAEAVETLSHAVAELARSQEN